MNPFRSTWLPSMFTPKQEEVEPETKDPSFTRPKELDPCELKLDWTILRRQARLARQMAFPYYEESTAGRWLLAGVLALTLLNSCVSVGFSFLARDFWNALNENDVPEFYRVLRNYLVALLVGAPVVTYYKYQREQLAVHWREWMTARTVSLYTKNRVYYNLPEQVDNPDQRIAEDVNSFTSYSLQLFIILLTSLIDLAAFSLILWTIYPQLFGAILLYAFIGSTVTMCLGQSLVGFNFFQLQREADLRYVLVRWRDNAESIAFYGGEDLEGQAVEQRLERVMNNRRRINVATRNLDFFTNSYVYLVQIVPVAVVAPKYFAGDIGLGVISQSVGAFNHILSDLSIIITQFEQLSYFSAGIERLASFYQAMREADLTRKNSTDLLPPPGPIVTRNDQKDAFDSDYDVPWVERISLRRYGVSEPLPGNDAALSIQHLHLYTPDSRRVLVQDLTLELRWGQHLLIVGNSGAGKSSLLRAIAGLWTAGHGSIHRPSDDQVYFLPQRPYCTLGSLKDQLLYPLLEYFQSESASTAAASETTPAVTGETLPTDVYHTFDSEIHTTKPAIAAAQQKIVPQAHIVKTNFSDDDLLEVLRQVDLFDVARRAGNGDAVKGLHVVSDWTNLLSLEEQQRLAFGRLLVNRPKLVILDEATSALDMAAEARMYTLLQNIERADVCGRSHQMTNTSSQTVVHLSPGLTYISVGHRPSLLAYHDKRLRLAGPDQSYEWSDIDKS